MKNVVVNATMKLASTQTQLFQSVLHFSLAQTRLCLKYLLVFDFNNFRANFTRLKIVPFLLIAYYLLI